METRSVLSTATTFSTSNASKNGSSERMFALSARCQILLPHDQAIQTPILRQDRRGEHRLQIQMLLQILQTAVVTPIPHPLPGEGLEGCVNYQIGPR